jgi:low affinity Fe/Cu permease
MAAHTTHTRSGVGGWLERASHTVTQGVGTSWAFAAAVAVVLAWALTGPIFKYSNTWQLVINTGTTIVTFLMVFLIQRSQNKDSRAVHLKLNELVSAMEGASNRLIDVEDLSEEELKALQGYYRALVELARRDSSVTKSHSVEEARASHHEKHGRRGAGRGSSASPASKT